jgi:pimeloyl-ACP methyl ester carboxylesterase
MTDPSLLRKHTTYESYTTSTATYPKIRTVYHPHSQASKLPSDIPLLVFVHGLGGSTAQFAPLLTSLINAAPCLAIDLPGCGLSEFKPDDLNAYTIATEPSTKRSLSLDIRWAARSPPS